MAGLGYGLHVYPPHITLQLLGRVIPVLLQHLIEINNALHIMLLTGVLW